MTFGEINFQSSRVPGVSEDDCDVQISFTKNLLGNLTQLSENSLVYLCFGLEPNAIAQCINSKLDDEGKDVSKIGEVEIKLTSERYSARFVVDFWFCSDLKELFCCSDKEVPGEAAAEVAIALFEALKNIKRFIIVSSYENRDIMDTFIQKSVIINGEIVEDSGTQTEDLGFLEGLSAAFLTLLTLKNGSPPASVFTLHKSSFMFSQQLVFDCLKLFVSDKPYNYWDKYLKDFSVNQKQFDSLYM